MPIKANLVAAPIKVLLINPPSGFLFVRREQEGEEAMLPNFARPVSPGIKRQDDCNTT
jgi:hypothetical protein